MKFFSKIIKKNTRKLSSKFQPLLIAYRNLKQLTSALLLENYRPFLLVYRKLLEIIIFPLIQKYRKMLYIMDIKKYWEKRDFFEELITRSGVIEFRQEEAEFLTERILKLRPSTILDVGCGYGAHLKLLAKYNLTLIGIDISMLLLMNARRDKYLTDVSLIQGDASQLCFNDNSFDLVFTRGVLQHLPPDMVNKVRYEMIRVSKQWILHHENENPPHKSDHHFKHDHAKFYCNVGFGNGLIHMTSPIADRYIFPRVDMRNSKSS